MKGNGDVAQGWLAKAESDLGAAELCLAAERSLDTACFHCQQAAEKLLKAWLVVNEREFPFVHDLRQLVTLCASADAGFERLRPEALMLTPYAVQLRYSAGWWPTLTEAGAAVEAAKRVRQFVMERWPTV